MLGYSQGHEKCHQPIQIPPAQPRGAQGCTMEGGNPNQGLVQATPWRAINLIVLDETHRDESWGAALQFQTKECVGQCWLGVGHNGLRGKAVLDHTGLLMGCLGNLEVNKCGGKIEGQEDNRGQLHVNSSSDHCSISVKR